MQCAAHPCTMVYLSQQAAGLSCRQASGHVCCQTTHQSPLQPRCPVLRQVQQAKLSRALVFFALVAFAASCAGEQGGGAQGAAGCRHGLRHGECCRNSSSSKCSSNGSYSSSEVWPSCVGAFVRLCALTGLRCVHALGHQLHDVLRPMLALPW